MTPLSVITGLFILVVTLLFICYPFPQLSMARHVNYNRMVGKTGLLSAEADRAWQVQATNMCDDAFHYRRHLLCSIILTRTDVYRSGRYVALPFLYSVLKIRFVENPTSLLLRYCAPSRKVAGSIPYGVTGNFYWHNTSGHTMALGLIQPLK